MASSTIFVSNTGRDSIIGQWQGDVQILSQTNPASKQLNLKSLVSLGLPTQSKPIFESRTINPPNFLIETIKQSLYWTKALLSGTDCFNSILKCVNLKEMSLVPAVQISAKDLSSPTFSDKELLNTDDDKDDLYGEWS